MLPGCVVFVLTVVFTPTGGPIVVPPRFSFEFPTSVRLLQTVQSLFFFVSLVFPPPGA